VLWIQLAREWVKLWDLVNSMVINLHVRPKSQNFMISSVTSQLLEMDITALS
jgi:hypothetical protein